MLTQSNTDHAKPHKAVFAFFISDLHLCASRPKITEAFLSFLKNDAIHADALYILGDFFEYWAGDDDLASPFHQTITHALKQLAAQNTQLYLMHGNRDFLMGEHFCKQANMTLLADPTLVTINNHDILLSHGDALCTDDADYQKMRLQFRDPAWQQQFLSQPLAKRKALIEQIRMQSEQAKSEKPAMIMDVNPNAVDALLSEHLYPPTFIHGHTHRPAEHTLMVNNHPMTRWVLGDWYEQGSFLALDENGFRTSKLPSA